MKLVMTLLVRDEEDIIESTIEYHLNQGVDFIIATDNNSEDNTIEILERFARMGYLYLINEPEDDYAQAKWVTRMARMACTQFKADWVINNDADEFWWPKFGTLKSTLEAVKPHFGTVTAPRTNFVPRPGGVDNFFERMIIREVTSLNALGSPLPPKVCHRAKPDVVVKQGNHGAYSPNLGPPLDRNPIHVLHFPLRSYSQFENKIKKGGNAYEHNRELHPSVGETWRVLYKIFLEGGLPEYYLKQCLDDQAIAIGIREGRLIIDQRLKYFMEHRRVPKTL